MKHVSLMMCLLTVGAGCGQASNHVSFVTKNNTSTAVDLEVLWWDFGYQASGAVFTVVPAPPGQNLAAQSFELEDDGHFNLVVSASVGTGPRIRLGPAISQYSTGAPIECLAVIDDVQASGIIAGDVKCQ